MLTAVVVHLESVAEAQIHRATGRGVHGFWFRHWAQVAPEMGNQLHQENQIASYTLSPLMGLPRPRRDGTVLLPEGMKTWFRITTLTASLSEALLSAWLPPLERGLKIEIPQSRSPNPKPSDENQNAPARWRVTGISLTPEQHPWAGQTTYSQLAGQRLFGKEGSRAWRLRFETPAAFHDSAGHLPFPLPNSLVKSWLRRWNAFAPIALPEDLPDQVRAGVVVSAYHLKTVPVRYGKRLVIGGVGWLKLSAVRLPPALRAAVSLLAHYAFYCGSGAKTAQGMGMTRPD